VTGVLAAILLVALPATTSAGLDDGTAIKGPSSPDPPPTGGSSANAQLTVRLKGKGHKVTVGKKQAVTGTLSPFAQGEKVTLSLLRGGKQEGKRTVDVHQAGANTGSFKMTTGRLIKPGNYLVEATHQRSDKLDQANARTKKFSIHYPGLHMGSHGPTVSILNQLLRKQGYYAPHGSHFRNSTGLAALAYRKVHGMARTMSAPPNVLKTLADGRGAFKLKNPGQGRHVEVDISRQVMALADKGKAQYTFPVSTGKPSTPTVRGTFHFYRKDPGYNSVGMYYSVYFIRGYATHGYTPVPNFPASHGCVRNPIPDSRFIYNWIHLGDPINVYG